MNVLNWSNLFSVGVRRIDEQHRILIDLLNRLGGADKNDPELRARVLSELLGYVERHFAFEENLMREHAYADADAHVQAHQDLAAQVQRMVERQGGDDPVSIDALTLFLRQWLVGHILQTDRRLGAALNRAGVR